MTYATDGCRYARPLPAPVRVERRAHTAKTWQPVTDVLAWDGDWLTVTHLPTSVMTAGSRWRLNGEEYQQRVIEVSNGVKVRLRRAA